MPEISNTISSNISYRKMGSGPAVVLVHGFPESGNLWRNIWDELAKKYTLLIPDLPGSGNSKLEQETSMADLAACIKDILDHEQIDKAVIVGHSMGGYVGFEFADKYPAMVAGLSLVHSTPAADDEEKKKTRRKAIELIQGGAKKTFIRQMVPNVFSTPFKEAHPEIIEEQIAQAMELEEKSLVNFYKAMIDRNDHSGNLKDAAYPLQWIVGIDDNIIYYKNILTYSNLSPVNFVSMYPDCGHMSMFEAEEKLRADLVAFFDYCYKNKE